MLFLISIHARFIQILKIVIAFSSLLETALRERSSPTGGLVLTGLAIRLDNIRG